MNSLERFISACRRKPVDRPPVWLMRQAGRYLPEYRQIRSKHGFIEMCKNPEIACEISLQPWQRYKMDAVIVFSDILFIPEAMGMTLTFRENEGPKLSGDVEALKEVDAKQAFDFVYKTIRLLKKKLPKDVPVIGFSGAPWTLACYMMNLLRDKGGDGVPPLQNLRKDDASLSPMLEKITKVVADYVKLQQEAGADVIQLFDTWAGDLSKEDFKTLELPCLQKIIKLSSSPEGAPFIVYTRKCGHILNELADTGADVVSIDPDTKMEDAIETIGESKAIQGNLDPKTLLISPGVVRQETSRLLSNIGKHPGHIINLGHGVLQTTPLECVEAFVETVKHS